MDYSKLDCRGQRCPLPIVNLSGRMKDLDVGDELEFIADDQSCVSDLPAWCGITGNELVKLDNTNGVITAVIRRAQ